ncbi:glycoside hydrolase family 16 protein [Infundibulicybe gibba]|nr:glycoside hydrolase family 16 protein [Infundibulicybe gibba]
MRYDLPVCLVALLVYSLPSSAVDPDNKSSGLRKQLASVWSKRSAPAAKRSNLNMNPNGSTFLWLPQDEFSGKTFFDDFNFYSDADPTHGHVNYVNSTTAFARNLVYTQPDGTVIMKGDNTSWLPMGTFRDSVRISSKAQYNTGLFILDLNRAPWGCGVWPAFWTLGNGQWPDLGEIDIIEGVHDNQHNQVAFHTASGCNLTPTANFSGTVVQTDGKNNTNCDGNINNNAGCGITEWSRASYGPFFDSRGGGVFAMKWDENGIAVWSFYRAAIPQDIIDGSPTPDTWGIPSAALDPSGCNPLKFFVNHSIIFDITFCGDWAGNSYATSGVQELVKPGLWTPLIFLQVLVNASWSINSLKVYRKQLLNGRISSAEALVSLSHSDVLQWIYLMICFAGMTWFL